MVLSACPDIADYAKGGIANWRDFLATAAVVRPMLGISPSAWEEARTVMGEAEAAVVVACLLQRSSTIQSAGGYLRELTRKAAEGEFSLGPILMAQTNAKNREKRSARGHGWLTVLRGAVPYFRLAPGAKGEFQSDPYRPR